MSYTSSIHDSNLQGAAACIAANFVCVCRTFPSSFALCLATVEPSAVSDELDSCIGQSNPILKLDETNAKFPEPSWLAAAHRCS